MAAEIRAEPELATNKPTVIWTPCCSIPGNAAAYRATPRRCDPHGGTARPRWHPIRQAGEDRCRACYPDASGSRGRIAATPSDHLTFLTTTIGGPFAATTFTHWFRRECDKAGLPHCSAHGLRKAAARRLAEAGCTAHEIGAITGHASLAELVRYTKAADQRRLAEAAMAKTRTSARKPAGRFAKKAGKVLKIKARK